VLLAFAAAIFYLVRASRDHAFLEAEEVLPGVLIIHSLLPYPTSRAPKMQ
jgi:hypothetical protein